MSRGDYRRPERRLDNGHETKAKIIIDRTKVILLFIVLDVPIFIKSIL